MHQYRIDKPRSRVTLRLLGGETVTGHIFMQPSAFRQLGHDSAVDVMNDADGFFAFERENGGIMIVAKDRIVEVSGITFSPDDELRRESALSAEVVIRLVDGTDRAGTMMIEMPSDRPRVVDFLNETNDRFLTLFGPDEIHLIAVRAVEFIRPLD